MLAAAQKRSQDCVNNNTPHPSKEACNNGFPLNSEPIQSNTGHATPVHQFPTPTFYMKDRGRGTCKNKTLNEDNRYKWNKATLTHILTRQEYCGDVVNFKTTKHFRDKRNHYVDRSQWQITENVHEPIIDRADFETAQRILENAPVKRPNGDGEIHPLSGLLFCKDCGAKMHIRIDYRNGGKRHVAYCSEYHKGKAKNPKCHSPHIIDADLLMEQEKLYVIEEKTYEAHIDEEVHLYGLLHQLAFLAGKIKDRRDMENLIDTARRYGEIADQMFDRWSIPGRYLVFGDKADLSRLKALELCELDAFYVDCEDDEDQPHA